MTAKILFVDDDPAHRYLVEHYLTAGKYQVITAANVSDALAMISDQEPDLLITDILMPTASGFDLAEAIQTKGWGGKFPIIFLSSENTVETRVNSYRRGGEYFMNKPCAPAELLAVVNSALRRSRMQAALL